MHKGILITIGIILIAGLTTTGLVIHHDSVVNRALAAQRAEEAQQAAAQAQQQQTSQKASQKQALQNCINTANQQEVSSLQDEDNTLKADNASGTYYDNNTVNSYVQQIQQQAQTQITECQAEYPQN